MVALLGTFMALVGIAVFCAAAVFHERLANAARLPVRREHRCGKCAYDLTGVEVDVCPECGSDRAMLEPLPERRRARIALWMAPALLSCLFGLAATQPNNLMATAFAGTACVVVFAIVCRKTPLMLYFVCLAAGLALTAIMGLAYHGRAEAIDPVSGSLAFLFLFVVPPATFLVYLWQGRIFSDRPARSLPAQAGR